MKPKFQQIWFISGISKILKQAKISMSACFRQLLEEEDMRLNKSKQKQQLQMEIMCEERATIWKALQSHLKKNSKCFILFSSSLFLRLAF